MAGEIDHYAAELADGIEAALPGWVEECVEAVMTRWKGSVPTGVAEAATEAGRRAQSDVGPKVRALLEQDIDEQRGTPLTLIRKAVAYPTEVLEAAGAPSVPRDDFAHHAFPDDVYDLSPATFGDLEPNLADAGLAWGAAKAFEHKRRHSTGSQR